jgi:hypothetical protein
MPFIHRWKAMQQRTGWPFEPWVSALIVVVSLVVLEFAIIGVFHLTGVPCK